MNNNYPGGKLMKRAQPLKYKKQHQGPNRARIREVVADLTRLCATHGIPTKRGTMRCAVCRKDGVNLAIRGNRRQMRLSPSLLKPMRPKGESTKRSLRRAGKRGIWFDAEPFYPQEAAA